MTVPVFPLPNVVFFPHTHLPLHIFEPRYRRMVTDALDGERLIAMVLARDDRPPGERPDTYGIGSLGRITVAEPLDDGRFDIVLQGIGRVKLDGYREAPGGYFTASARLLRETLPDLQDPEVADEKARFLLVARRYGEQVLAGEYGKDFLNDVVPYEMLVSRAAHMLRTGVEQKQGLLTLDDVEERARKIEKEMSGQLDAQRAVDRFRHRRPDEPGRN